MKDRVLFIIIVLIFLPTGLHFGFDIFSARISTWLENFRAIYIGIFPACFFILTYLGLSLFDYNDYEQDNKRLILRRSGLGNSNGLIEVFIWGRTTNYKNDPRGNKIFLRSAYVVSVLTLNIGFFFFIKLLLEKNSNFQHLKIANKDFVVFYSSFFLAISTIFWKEREKFADKWHYLANLYNLLVKEQNNDVEKNCFAIDAVVLMQWGHRSFKDLVFAECEKSIRLIAKDTIDDSEIRKKINGKFFSEDEIIFILENYQCFLLNLFHNKSFNFVKKETDFKEKDWFNKLHKKNIDK